MTCQPTNECLKKLWEDHHAMADAVHGLLGRVLMLEARMDCIAIPPPADRPRQSPAGEASPPVNGQPRAMPTGLLHLGRGLWVVEGETGLWCGKRDFDDVRPVGIWVRTPDRRGNARTKRLYRLDNVTARLGPLLQRALLEPVTATGGNHDDGLDVTG